MVTCWKCCETIPQNCTCEESPREKRLRFLELAVREYTLISKIIREDFVPRVTIGQDELPLEVRIYHYRDGIAAILSLEGIKSPDWRKHRTLILYDVEGAPLYRRKLSKMVRVRKGDELTEFQWVLGVQSSGDSVILDLEDGK